MKSKLFHRSWLHPLLYSLILANLICVLVVSSAFRHDVLQYWHIAILIVVAVAIKLLFMIVIETDER